MNFSKKQIKEEIKYLKKQISGSSAEKISVLNKKVKKLKHLLKIK